MTRHSEKIWRSVVFAGAMLGAPLVSADAPQKPTKPAPPSNSKPAPSADTVDSVTKQIAAVDKLIKADSEAVAAAQNQADRDAAKAKLDRHKAEKAALEQKLAVLKQGSKPAPPPTPLQQLEQERAELQKKLDAATATVAAAQNEADRKAAKANLDALTKDKAELDKKITAEKQKLARPRTGEKDRPVGRGFVLA